MTVINRETHEVKGTNERREDNSAVQDEALRNNGVLGELPLPHEIEGDEHASNDLHRDHRRCKSETPRVSVHPCLIET